MTDYNKSKFHIKLKVFCWCIFLAATLYLYFHLDNKFEQAYLSCYNYNAQESTLAESSANYLLFLDADNNEMLNKNELTSIKTIAKSWQAENKNSAICIISPEKIRGLYAKIVLHSYGVGIGKITVAKEVNNFSLGNEANLYFSGVAPKKYTTLFDKQNINAQKLAGSKITIHPANVQLTRAAIVLGNQPLGLDTPTIDLIQRTLAAVNFYIDHPDSLLVFSGAATTGGISEARMMAVIAESRGVPASAYILDEKSYTTQDNAFNTAKLLSDSNYNNITVISKASHLRVALPFFKKYFNTDKVNINCIPVKVSTEDLIRQMEDYGRIYNNKIALGRADTLRFVEHEVGVD